MDTDGLGVSNDWLVYEAFDLELGCAEVEQEADFHADCPQVVQALGVMDLVVCFDRLELDGHRTVDDQIGDVLADDKTVVLDRNWLIGFCCSTRSPAFLSSCARAFSYTFSRNPAPSVLLTVNAQPMIFPVGSSNSF